jgi:hypothetical protein
MLCKNIDNPGFAWEGGVFVIEETLIIALASQ